MAQKAIKSDGSVVVFGPIILEKEGSRIDALIFHSSVPLQLEKQSECSASFISLCRGSLEFHGIT